MQYVRFIVLGCALLIGLISPAYAQTQKPVDLTIPHAPQTIVIKTRQPVAEGGKSQLMSRLGGVSFRENVIESVAPALPWIAEGLRAGRIASHPLATIYLLKITPEADLNALITELNEQEEILFAEPYYLYRPLLIPNDPGVGSQYYLEKISAYDAWNVEQGDTTITIGMLDTGIDYTHEDMRANIQYNHNDPVNGTDDDGDGLVDNFFGWDIANGDNVPLPDTDIHGSAVAGVSSAEVNNNLGIAGLGYRTRTLPIKIFTSGSNLFRKGYEAIALAADLGCQVINLSWGEAGAYSQFGEEIIRYAVLEKDVAIVAAAGNTNAQLDYYPASYPYVLSVGATDQNDRKTSWGTYSPYMDLTAPGEQIQTVFNDNTYGATSGTSLSAPMVAAAVALVRARFPELSARQAMEKVRVNADDIQSAQQQGSWTGFLGKGRLNVFRALTDITSPSLRVKEFSYGNALGEEVYFSDTVDLNLSFINYLYPSAATVVRISSGSPYVDFLNQEISLPGIPTLGESQQKTTLVLRDDTPPGTRILLRLDYSSGAYQDHEYLEFTTAPDWATLDNGQMQFTVSADGNLGYASNLKQDGTGLTTSSTQLLDNIGLVIRSENIVMDNMPVRQSQHAREQDFITRTGLRRSASSIADHYISSEFITDPARSPRLPLTVKQHSFTWDSLNAVFVDYFITNTSDSALSGFQPAVFADFDLNNEVMNRLELSADQKFQYTYDDSGNLFGGVEILSSLPAFHTALDKRNLDGNSSDLPPYVSDEIKRELFRIEKQAAGTEGAGNDVAGLSGLQPIILNAGESIRFAFILTSAGSLEELNQVHEEARNLYAQFRTSPPVGLITRFCPGETALVNPAGTQARFYSDAQGSGLLAEGDSYSIPDAQEAMTLYAENIVDGVRGEIYRILVLPADVQTDFDMPDPLLLLDEENNTKVTFTDLSRDAASWNWTFSNGYSSVKQNPSIHFTQPGVFTVRLESSNAFGCSGTMTKTLEVARRNARPAARSFAGCPGSSFQFDPADTDSVHVYADQTLTHRLHAGTDFITGALSADTVFYVTSLDGPYESLPAAFRVDIQEISAQFSAAPDTLMLDNPYLLRLTASDREVIFSEWSIRNESGTFPLSNGFDLLFDYSSLTSFTIQLTTVNSSGCTAYREETFTPTRSPAPDIPASTVCAGETGTIRPASGGFYHFYADAGLNTLIGKGSTFTIPELSRDTLVYVVAMDDLLESSVVAASIEVSKLRALFSVPEEAINLNQQPVIALEDGSQGEVAARSWTIDDVPAGTEEVFEFRPDGPGDYQIGLSVEDLFGCQSGLNQLVRVVMITGLGTQEIHRLPYPNPASTFITLPGLPRHLILIGTDGRRVRECSECTGLPVSGLAPGTYLLRVTDRQESNDFKIIID